MAKKESNPKPPPIENKPPPPPAPPKSELLTMVKDGYEPIRVHPRQVEPWQRQGWKVEE